MKKVIHVHPTISILFTSFKNTSSFSISLYVTCFRQQTILVPICCALSSLSVSLEWGRAWGLKTRHSITAVALPMQNRDEYSLPFTCQLHVTNASICNCFLPPNSIPLWLGAPVYSFSAVYSFSSLQFLIFLCLSSVRNFLFSYCGPKLHLPIILHKVTDNSRALRRLSLKIDLLSWVLVSPGQSVRGPRLPIP